MAPVTTALLCLGGFIVGSFLNVVIHRLPREQSIVGPRSRCPTCNEPLPAVDLVPVVSYVLLRGRCRRCQARIPPRYPLVELATGGLFAAAGGAAGAASLGGLLAASQALAVDLTLIAVVVAAAVIDLEHRLIPNRLVAAGTVLAVPLTVLPGPPSPLGAAAGAAVGGGFFLLVYLAVPGGMGGGDVKLAGMIGLYLGVLPTIVALFVAVITGAVAGLVMIALSFTSLKEHIPFGPFLALGAVAAALWTEEVVTAYLLWL